MPARLQTRIWHKVHGVLLNRAKRPRVLREYILCNIILNMVPRLREPASILEFGCSSGALTQRLLHFVDVAQNADTDVVVYGFDTFAGLPEGDPNLDYQKERIAGQGGYWVKGTFASDKAEVEQNLRKFGFNNFRLIKGLFEDTLTDERLEELKARPPFLVVIDCDYYTSTVQVLKRLLPVLPNGCVFYFDDTFLNYYSTLTGELRAIKELNSGAFGDGVELVEAYDLGLLGRRFYRFVSRHADQSQEVDHTEIAEWVIKPSRWLSPAPEGRRLGQTVVRQSDVKRVKL